MEVFLLILRLALAIIFGVAGIAKLFDPAGSQKAFTEFGLPKALAKPMASALPAFELSIALALLFVQSSWFGAIGASILFLIFIGGMLYQYSKGKAPDCHCFGQLHSEPVGVSSIIRNVLMLLPAVLLLFQGRTNQGLNLVHTDQDVMLLVIGLPVVVLLFAAVLYLQKVSEQQTQIMRRIELIDLMGDTAIDNTVVEREGIGHPRDGLPIGSLVPDFELPNMDGKVVSLADLKSEAKPILFFFVSPTCTTCRSLLPQFAHWQNILSDKVSFVYISNGDVEDNKAKFSEDILKHFLLQQTYEITENLFGAKWSPTAVLVDANGRIASFSAAGDVGIAELVNKITASAGLKEFTYFTSDKAPPQAPIKIGDSVPDFSLTDLNGNTVDRSFFKEKATLVAFWTLGCSFCDEMMNEIKEWDASKNGSDVNLLIFSDGDKQELLDLGLKSPLLIDKGLNIAAKLGMFSTPSAIVVDENGKFVSETAIGSEDIWALIGKRK